MVKNMMQVPCKPSGSAGTDSYVPLATDLGEAEKSNSILVEDELLFVGLRVRMSITTGKAELAGQNVVSPSKCCESIPSSR